MDIELNWPEPIAAGHFPGGSWRTANARLGQKKHYVWLMCSEVEDLDDDWRMLIDQWMGTEPTIASEAAVGWGDHG